MSCVCRPIQIISLDWGSRKSVAGARIVGGRGETFEAERLGSAIDCIMKVALSIDLCWAVADYRSTCFVSEADVVASMCV